MLWPLFPGCSLRCLLLPICMRDTIAQANAFLSISLEAAELAGWTSLCFRTGILLDAPRGQHDGGAGQQVPLRLSVCCRSVMTALASALEGAAGPEADAAESTGRPVYAAAL